MTIHDASGRPLKKLLNLFRAPAPAESKSEKANTAPAPGQTLKSKESSSAKPAPAQKKSEDSQAKPQPKGSTVETTNVRFDQLKLHADLQKAIKEEGYEHPTPIQVSAIPHVLEGRDLIGCAQTGTGKTAAFALPILDRLISSKAQRAGIRVLVLSPTRELALQIADSFKTYGRHTSLKTAVIFGGVGAEPQRRALKANPDILVATPGRFLDLKQQGFIRLDKLDVFVLDEADRMLDMGFIHDVKKIISSLPSPRQNLLFSATMPKDIQELSMRFLKNPAQVAVTPVSSTSELVDQYVYHVDRVNKRHLLLHVLENAGVTKAILFTRTKAIANRVSEFLCSSGISAEAIHGNKSQSARQRALENFRTGQTRILVASDLAARGIDVDGISHVINYDVPNVAETYVHRIGRTGRAHAAGTALSFCEMEEQSFIHGIEKLTGMKIPVVTDHPFPRLGIPNPAAASGGGRGRGQRQGNRGGRRPQGSSQGSQGGNAQRSGGGQGGRGSAPRGNRSGGSGGNSGGRGR
jgi:ATP-dependent RNA helicase RhlE